MADDENKEQYQTRYGTFTSESVAAVADDQTLVADNVDAEGQITTLEIYCTDPNDFEIQVDTLSNDADALPFDPTVNTEGSAVTKKNFVGKSEYKIGSFEDPALEMGGRNQVQVNLVGSATGTIAVNIRVDERLG